jgi:hypothetical protein
MIAIAGSKAIFMMKQGRQAIHKGAVKLNRPALPRVPGFGSHPRPDSTAMDLLRSGFGLDAGCVHGKKDLLYLCSLSQGHSLTCISALFVADYTPW